MKNKLFKIILLVLLVWGGLAPVSGFAKGSKNKFMVIGYVGAFGKLINVDAISAKKLTHINYAFVNCKDSMVYLDNPKNDTINFIMLNNLKKINADLKILISIGGGSRSVYFSDAVLTPTSRRMFVKSAVDLIHKFDMDGIDVDWEYPGQIGNNNNIFRPVEDKQNFTLMFIEFRTQLDSLSIITGKKYLLTGAFNVSKNFTDHIELEEVAKSMDFINLMTYDFSGPKNTVGHHTNLYNYGHLNPRSADKGIRDYISMGVPPEKLALGVAFYSHGILSSTTKFNGLGEPIDTAVEKKPIQGGGYTFLKDSLIDKKGYKRYWDEEAQAPYLFNEITKHFITYDDEKSTKEKAKYVKKNKLAGAFFWQYFSDPKDYLLDVLDKELLK